MGKFDKILLATDLDGTLLRADKSISEENLKAIEYFKKEGGKFTFLTGRIPLGAMPIYKMVKPNAPIGCINGGGIYDFESKKYLWCKTLDKSALELAEFIMDNIPKVGLEAITKDVTYFCIKNKRAERHRIDEEFEDLRANLREIDEDLTKLIFTGDMEVIEEVKSLLSKHELSSQFGFIRSDKYYYEILPKGVNKGKLVEKISKMLESELVITVGDNDNDVSMLEVGDISFAVANASESAKKAAKYVTVSNEEHAIAKIIYDLEKFNGKTN